MPAPTEADVTDSKTDTPEAASQGFGMAALQLALEPGDNLARIADEVAAIRRRLPWVRMVVLGELGVFVPNPALAQTLPVTAEQLLCDGASKNRDGNTVGKGKSESARRVYGGCRSKTKKKER